MLSSESMRNMKRNRVGSHFSPNDMERRIIHMLDGKTRQTQTIKMILVMLFPVIGLLGMTLYSLVGSVHVYNDARGTITIVQDSLVITRLVSSLQVERGFSSLFLSGTGDIPIEDNLRKARSNTDNWLSEVDKFPDNVWFRKQYVSHKFEFSSIILRVREKVFVREISIREAIHYYTDISIALTDANIESIYLPSHGELWPFLIAFQSIFKATDYIGIQRALGSTYFTPCSLDEDFSIWFYQLETQLEDYTSLAFQYDSASKNFYKSEMDKNKELVNTVMQYKEMFLNTQFQEVCLNQTHEWRIEEAFFWFNNASQFLKIIIDTSLFSAQHIQNKLASIQTGTKTLVAMYSVIAVIFTVMSLTLTAWYAENIYKMTGKMKDFATHISQKTEELKEEKKTTDALLHQMLPKSIVQKLKNKEKMEAEFYENVTVFFSDIVGFTTISAKSSPHQVCTFLNMIYM